jgi:hypothetical protein
LIRADLDVIGLCCGGVCAWLAPICRCRNGTPDHAALDEDSAYASVVSQSRLRVMNILTIVTADVDQGHAQELIAAYERLLAGGLPDGLLYEDQFQLWRHGSRRPPFYSRTAHSGPDTRGQHMNGKLTTTCSTTAVQITSAQMTGAQITRYQTGADLAVGAEFCYDPADPLAVTMVIDSIPGPVRWTFARELILNGQFEPTGDGDVHIWPCLDTEGAAVVIVELDSPAGRAILQFSSRAVQEFLSASLATVPAGEEQHDVDAWIQQLFAGTEIATT